VLPESFFLRDPREVAVELLNKVLVHDDASITGTPRAPGITGTPRAPGAGRLAGRIVEVEAYLGTADPGSHAYRGPSRRNATMFGPPGHLYVYFTYGMHWCSNVVCCPEDTAGAVLLRGLAPLEGLETMRARRPLARKDRDLCSGPARLTQALGLDGRFDGVDLRSGPVRLVDDGTPPPAEPGNSRRIGLSAGRGDEHPWRWYVAGDPNVSRR
jgi:DNA-3-methyladenine glycosylase